MQSPAAWCRHRRPPSDGRIPPTGRRPGHADPPPGAAPKPASRTAPGSAPCRRACRPTARWAWRASQPADAARRDAGDDRHGGFGQRVQSRGAGAHPIGSADLRVVGIGFLGRDDGAVDFVGQRIGRVEGRLGAGGEQAAGIGNAQRLGDLGGVRLAERIFRIVVAGRRIGAPLSALAVWSAPICWRRRSRACRRSAARRRYRLSPRQIGGHDPGARIVPADRQALIHQGLRGAQIAQAIAAPTAVRRASRLPGSRRSRAWAMASDWRGWRAV